MSIMNTTKKQNKYFAIGIVLILIGCLSICLLLFQSKSPTIKNMADSDYHTMQYKNKKYEYDTSIINVLAMGVDSSDGSVGQADALQLYQFHRDTKSISVLSLDRDTLTPIQLFDVEHNALGWKKQHLALAYAYGRDTGNGALLTNKAVSKMLYGIPINKYVALDLSKLSELQDVVGSFEVTVPNDSLVSVNPAWTKGSVITLDSSNVESFVRARDTEQNYTNEDRMERQKAYLNAYYAKLNEVLQSGYKETLNKIYNLLQSVTSNITYNEVESYVKMVQTYKYDQDKFYELPGKSRVGAMHDEFILDKSRLKELVINMYYKEG